MLMIRLQRVGAKKHPLYRVVVSDSRKRPSADSIDMVGTYNPHLDPPEIQIDHEKVDQWVEKGAQLSHTVRSLLHTAKRAQ